MPRKKAKKKKTTFVQTEKEVPRSMVIARGRVTAPLRKLVKDVRAAMLPYTAMKLKSLRDFLDVAQALGTTQIISFSQTDLGSYIHIYQLPRGPTIHGKIEGYSLVKDLRNIFKRPPSMEGVKNIPPVVVTHGFLPKNEKDKYSYLPQIGRVFRRMFPQIELDTVALSEVKRVILFQYDPKTQLIHLRHFKINIRMRGVKRRVKKLLRDPKQGLKRIPNLGKYDNISEFLENEDAVSSDSEFDDPEGSHVVLPQDLGIGNAKGRKSAIRLNELGPRISFKVIKMEEKINRGKVLYNAYFTKTKEDIKQQEAHLKKKSALKQSRVEEQDINVRKKKEEEEKKLQEKEAKFSLQKQRLLEKLMSRNVKRKKPMMLGPDRPTKIKANAPINVESSADEESDSE